MKQNRKAFNIIIGIIFLLVGIKSIISASYLLGGIFIVSGIVYFYATIKNWSD